MFLLSLWYCKGKISEGSYTRLPETHKTMPSILNNHLKVFEFFFLVNEGTSYSNPTFYQEMNNSAHLKYTANVFTTSMFNFLQSEYLRICQSVMEALYENE